MFVSLLYGDIQGVLNGVVYGVLNDGVLNGDIQGVLLTLTHVTVLLQPVVQKQLLPIKFCTSVHGRAVVM